MAKRYIVRLSDEERMPLTGLLGKKVLAAQKRKRAEVLLKADAGKGGPAWVDSRIAEAFEVSVVTVENLRKSYVLEGLDATIERGNRFWMVRRRRGWWPCVVERCRPDMAGGPSACWRTSWWNCRSWRAFRMKPSGRLLKKRIAALASDDVVHSAGTKRRVRLRYGDGAGRVPAAV
jgi:hypothetical protein